MIHPFLVAALWSLQSPIRINKGGLLDAAEVAEITGEVHPPRELVFWAEQIARDGLAAWPSWAAILERWDTPENAAALDRMERRVGAAIGRRAERDEAQRRENREHIEWFRQFFATRRGKSA